MNDTSSLTSRVVKGVAWVAGARVVVRLLGFVSMLILARLLTPDDFGVVALATSVIAFLELFTTFSFDIALIQRHELSRVHLDTVWTLTLCFYAGVALVLAALAAPAAAFYREPRLEAVLYAMSGAELIKGFASVGTVYFRRQLDFQKDFLLQVSAKVAGFITVLPLAFILRNHWALVLGILVTNVTTTAVSYLMHSYRPWFSFAAARELMGFSAWLLVNNFFTFLRNRGADLIIGRRLGAQSVGVFSLSFEIASLPTTEAVAPINRVAFPAYVRVAHDPARLERAFLDALAIIALLLLPLSIGIAAVADLAVPVLLGDKWSAAVPVVVALAFYSALNSLGTNTGSIYNALGKPKMISITGAIQLGTLIPLLVVVAGYGELERVAWAFTLHAALIGVPVTYWLFVKYTPVRLAGIVGVIWRPALASLLMYVAVRALVAETTLLHAHPVFIQLVVCVAAGLFVYCGLSAALWLAAGCPNSAEKRVLSWMMSRARAAF